MVMPQTLRAPMSRSQRKKFSQKQNELGNCLLRGQGTLDFVISICPVLSKQNIYARPLRGSTSYVTNDFLNSAVAVDVV